MKRKVVSACCGAAAMFACAMAPSVLLAQDHPSGQEHPSKKEHPGTQEHPGKQEHPGGPDMQAVMKAWQEFATPGEHHGHLGQWVGEWDLTVEMWHGPGQPPVTSKATSQARLIMGGRYLLEDVRGSFDMEGEQMAFEGMSLMGFDNHKKQYFSVWIDNMGTGLWEEWGTCDAAGRILTTKGRSYDPMVGAERDSKSVATVVDADTRKLEMFMPGPDGKMFKNMEITYRRRK